jgi:3alpha(or 20beta)-hydroxysteroid dehydrogenase
MTRLNGKIAVITGGARGMGASHVRRFVEEGARVVVTDIRTEEGQDLVAELGDCAAFVQHDVSDPRQWSNVISRAEERFGPISVLVNNAGSGCFETLESASIDAYRRAIEINQSSVFYGMRAALPSLRRAGGGSIVNVSSVSGIVPAVGIFPFAAAKAAVRVMSKAAALELAADKIRVNTVFPGSHMTPAFKEYLDAGGTVAEKLLDIARNIPMGRIAEAHECTGMVLFLASDEASYCTGGDYVVDGGLISQ